MMVNHLQEKLFRIILHRYAEKREAVQALMGVLDKSQDAIYRRLRGSTILTADEFALLANTYGISMDALALSGANQVLFTYNLQLDQVGRVENYLEHVLTLATELTSTPETRLWYTAREIPVFSYYSFYPLLAFKMFVYAKTYWNLADPGEAKFHLTPPDKRYEALSRQIATRYLHINSTEIWNPDLLNNTLNQIFFFLDSEQFARPEEAIILCYSLGDMVNYTRAMAARGRKFDPGDPGRSLGAYRLYLNEFSSTTDTLLIAHHKTKTLITSFGTPNFLRCNEERLCNEIERWMDGIIQRSTPISHGQARHRELFFNRLLHRIDRARKKIEQRLSA